MKYGISLHVGVRRTSPEAYRDESYTILKGPIHDAYRMQELAAAKRFQSTSVLLDEHATHRAVERHIRGASRRLQAGQTFLWSYSGHGTRFPSGGDNGFNEGMVLYDSILLDDDINVLLRGFRAGVRIIMVADCCYSQTIYEHSKIKPRRGPDRAPDYYATHPGWRNRLLDATIAEDHYRRHAQYYKARRRRLEREGATLSPHVMAQLVMLAACQENQLADDTPSGGVFTKCLLDAMNGVGTPIKGPYNGTYTGLRELIHGLACNGQNPDISFHGPDSKSDSYPFFQGPPFSL